MSLLVASLFCIMPVAYDGDTVRCGTTPVRIRLWGVNAPEIGTDGAAASKAALGIATAGGVVCIPRGTSFARIVAQCFNGKGEDIAALQLAGGYAVEDCAFSKGYYGRCG